MRRDIPPCPLCSKGLWDSCPEYRRWHDKYDGGGEGNRVPPTEKELGEATPPGAHREPPPLKQAD